MSSWVGLPLPYRWECWHPKSLRKHFRLLKVLTFLCFMFFWYLPSDTVHRGSSELWTCMVVGQCWRGFGLSWQSWHLNITACCQAWHPLFGNFAPQCDAFPIQSFFMSFPSQRLSSQNPVWPCICTQGPSPFLHTVDKSCSGPDPSSLAPLHGSAHMFLWQLTSVWPLRASAWAAHKMSPQKKNEALQTTWKQFRIRA